jgi:serine/threonine protein kinase
MLQQDAAFKARYELGNQIGAGNMGAVYRGVQRVLDRPVAIKVMNPDLLRDPLLKERFTFEAKVAARLRHANVVAVDDFGFAGGVPYIVHEFVEGESLLEFIAANPRLTPAKVVNIAQQTLDGLQAIHSLNIIHRDLKPANIILTRGTRTQVKILDFGIAKEFQEGGTQPGLTLSGCTLGTPDYMSPEQCLGKPLTAASDLYSFSVILYEMVVGKRPFLSANPVQQMDDHITKPPPMPPGLPASLRELLQKGLAKDPAERPESAEAYNLMLDRLDPAVLTSGWHTVGGESSGISQSRASNSASYRRRSRSTISSSAMTMMDAPTARSVEVDSRPPTPIASRSQANRVSNTEIRQLASVEPKGFLNWLSPIALLATGSLLTVALSSLVPRPSPAPSPPAPPKFTIVPVVIPSPIQTTSIPAPPQHPVPALIAPRNLPRLNPPAGVIPASAAPTLAARPTPEYTFELARKARVQKDDASAANALMLASIQGPLPPQSGELAAWLAERAKLHLDSAVALRRQKKIPECLQEYGLAIKCDRSLLSQLEPKVCEKLLMYWRTQTEQNSSDSQTFFDHGIFSYLLGDLASARESFLRAETLAPDDYTRWKTTTWRQRVIQEEAESIQAAPAVRPRLQRANDAQLWPSGQPAPAH